MPGAACWSAATIDRDGREMARQTIKIRFYDRQGQDMGADVDTDDPDASHLKSWEDWYNDHAVEHDGPKNDQGLDGWDTFAVIYE
jgi:hypothetical protein